MASNGLGLAVLPAFQCVAQACRIAVVPGRFGEQASGMGVAGFGDAAAAHGVAAGAFGRHQPQVAHQMPRVGKALDVTDFGDQANGADGVDAAQGAQSRHHGFKAPSAGTLGQRQVQAGQTFIGCLRGQDVLGERQLIASVLEGLVGQPACVGLVPGRFAGIDPAVAQQESLQVLARFQAHLQSVLASTPQIAQRFVLDVRYPDRLQLPGAQQLGQACAVAPIGLDAVTGALRNQRRRHHLAAIPFPNQTPIQPVAGRARLISHQLRRRRPQLAQHLQQGRHIVPDRSPKLTRLPTRLAHRNRDRFLMNIQPDKDLDILIHGSSPDSLRLAYPTACGSAHLGAQPTLAETGLLPHGHSV